MKQLTQDEVVMILEKLESMNLLRLSRFRLPWYSVYCPFHNDGNERKPSAGVLLNEQVKNGTTTYPGNFHCFTCHRAYSIQNLITELLKKSNSTMTGLEWLKQHVPDFDPDVEFEYLVPDNVMAAATNVYMLNYIRTAASNPTKFISEEELASYRFTVPYMYERKLTDEIIEKYDIGFDANWVPPGRKKPVPCITFPVRDSDGNTLFIARRSVEGKMFYIPTEVTKPVYGIDMIPQGTRTVIICESVFNALTCIRYGYPAVALFGTGTDYQINQLKRLGCSEFVIAMDGDEAGWKATKRLKSRLSKVALIWTMHLPEGEDINSISEESFYQIYNDRD